MSPNLPSDFKAALAALTEGASGRDLATRAARLSDLYRSGLGSRIAIACEADALAYALVRAPATYAACIGAMTRLAERAPGFAPGSVLDAGSGVATASWATCEVWDGIADVTLLDDSALFLDLAARLATAGPPSLMNAAGVRGDFSHAAALAPHDLVVASYALTELADVRLGSAVEALWSRAGQVLLLLEPGTPAGWRRVLLCRDFLIKAGGVVIGPCPHALACPLAPPDWCHFSQRLERSRGHRAAKGATLSYEDEKYVWLAVARPAALAALHLSPPAARVLAPPGVAKAGVALKLCESDGQMRTRQAAKRDRAAFAAAKRLNWGDVLPG